MNQTNTSIPTPVLVGVAGCFLLSGFAALLYQMAWMRQFSTVFGTSETAVATVLSAYMGGLALGAALAGKLVQRIRRPVLFYGLLEAAIAVSALLVPTLLAFAGILYATVLGDQASIPDAAGWGQPMFYFVVAFAVLIVPTACMGATLPVLTRYVVSSDDQIGRRVGGLYAINTLGAVCGAAVAGLILLPQLGLRGTVWCGVAINILVFVIAVLVAKNAHAGPPPEETVAPEHGPSGYAWMILPIMLLSGVCTFVYEVLWTRLLSHILGGSVAAFAIMLASFLTGIALGSLIASRVANTRPIAAKAFVISQLGIAATSILIYYSLDHYLQTGLTYEARVLAAFLVLMPATLFIGATFPLAVRIYAPGADVAARSSARVYAWNTVGAIFGAAIAGFFLVPLLKYEGAVRAVVLLNLGLALTAAIIFSTTRRLQLAFSAGVMVVVAVLYDPSAPERILRFSPLLETATGDIVFYDVGRSATVLVVEQDGEFRLRNNGLPEAAVVSQGTPPMLDSQRVLGTFPVIIRPDTKSALIVGLGGGKAITGLPPTVEEVDVIELEPKVIAANQAISDRLKFDPLQDPRVSIYVNDARSALALSSKKYDMIVSQPSHPWSAGASHLYTSEYMALVADHLNEGGVFLQWINSQFVDETLLKSLCATILEVYPHVRIYQWSPQVLFFVASDQPMDVEQQILSSGRPFKDAPLFYLELGVAVVEDVVAALMIDEQGVRKFAAGSRVITDDFNMMAMESAALMRDGRELDIDKLASTFRPWVPALDEDSWLHELPDQALDFSRVADKYVSLQVRTYLPDLFSALNKAGNPQAMLVAGNLRDGEGKREEARALFVAALEASPDSNQAKYALVEPWLRQLGRNQVPEEIVSIANSMTGSARAVIEAARAVAQRDLQSVADLDPQLAAAGPADPWFTEAVKLRIDWRSSVSNPELTKQFSEQSWRILDLAMANRSDHEFLGMRIFAASRAGRQNEVIQSARGYIKTVDFQLTGVEEGYIAPGMQELALKSRQLNTIIELTAEARRVASDSTRSDLQSGFDNLSQRLQVLSQKQSEKQ
ncbi:MAG: fused MFS/spermidine synthase [Woeseiaceae bacterium]